MFTHRSHRINHWSVRGPFLALLASLAGGSATAEERFVVTRDGQKVPVVLSTTEFAVTLEPTDDVQTAVRQLESSIGRLEDTPHAPDSRLKILRVDQTTRAHRARVRQVPAVESVHSIVRYKGTDAPIACTGTINVKVRADVSAAELDGLWADHGLTVMQQVDGLERVFVVKPNVEDADDLLRAELLADDARTEWAQPNFRIPTRRHQVTPVDPFFGQQWHLNNTGQSEGLADADIDAPEAWLLSQGQDILIGMFDDACDVDHEDLRSNYIGQGHDPSLSANASGFNDPRPKQLGDFHGTAVMGLAVARANSLGVRGVAHLSRFTASRGLGQSLTDAEIASVYTFARQQEVDVHINSWGFSFGMRTPAIIEDAIETAFLEGRDIDGPDGAGRPRGMVVVFASGNGTNNFGPGVQVEAGRELATLPTVIGVGASTVFDTLASYSNFGPEIDLLAPGGGDFAGIRTTDVDDNAGFVEKGDNVGGVDPFTGNPQLDSDGLYSNSFAGTSAACPIVAGTAALILSANPSLTATDVRLILEHTADTIDADNAEYDGITGRSLRYGYGRINARAAAQAARESLTNGGRTWPERVANIQTSTNTLRWRQNGNPLEYPAEDEDDDEPTLVLPPTTNEFLVLQSSGEPFDFNPDDGACYDTRQLGCGNAVLQPLPDGVTVAAVGCQNLVCGTDVGGSCTIGEQRCIDFIPTAGVTYFAVYARSFIGRYSFGVRADTGGDVLDEGQLPPGGGGSGGGTDPGGGDMPVRGPSVTIMTSPPSPDGNSPLSVSFTGNAASPVGLQIDDSRTAWDFDLDNLLQNGVTVDATTRNTQFTYTAPAGETRVFTARLTMYDVAGNVGSAQVNVRVAGQGSSSDGGALDEEVRIVVRERGGADEVTQGVSPFSVEMSLDTTAVVQSITWDLGDGTIVRTVQVSHTYENTTAQELSLPVSATVDIRTTAGTVVRRMAAKQISVLPGAPITETPDINLPGTGATGGGGSSSSTCGITGMLPLAFLFMSLMWMRRRR